MQSLCFQGSVLDHRSAEILHPPSSSALQNFFMLRAPIKCYLAWHRAKASQELKKHPLHGRKSCFDFSPVLICGLLAMFESK